MNHDSESTRLNKLSGLAKKRNRKRQQATRKLRMEGLEDRRLLAVDFGDIIRNFEGTWTYRALESQRNMAINEPISNVMHIGSHNAFNTIEGKHYAPLPVVGPQQTLSLTKQLRAGVRVLEIDIDRELEFKVDDDGVFETIVDIATGTLGQVLEIRDKLEDVTFQQTNRPAVMHTEWGGRFSGQRSVRAVFNDIKDFFVDSDGNPTNRDELVLLNIQDDYTGGSNRPESAWTDLLDGPSDDGDEDIFHSIGVDAVTAKDPRVYNAATGVWKSRKEIIDAGVNIIYKTNTESFTSQTTDSEQRRVQNFSPSGVERPGIFETVQGDRMPAGADQVTSSKLSEYARNNVNIVRMDFILGKDGDEDHLEVEDGNIFQITDALKSKLAGGLGVAASEVGNTYEANFPNGARKDLLHNAIWSWEDNDAALNDVDGLNVAIQPEGQRRWNSGGAYSSTNLPFALRSVERFDSDGNQVGPSASGNHLWKVSNFTGSWNDFILIPQSELVDLDGTEWMFAGPLNGIQNGILNEAKAGLETDVWINVQDANEDQNWVVNQQSYTVVVVSPDGELAIVDVAPEDKDDNLTISYDATTDEYIVFDPINLMDVPNAPGHIGQDTNTARIPAANITSIMIDTRDGADVVTIDNSTPIPAPIEYSGGRNTRGGGDLLRVLGDGLIQTATYTPDRAPFPGSGVVDLSAGGSIRFFGLEPVEFANMAKVTFQSFGDKDELQVVNRTASGGETAVAIEGTVDGMAFEVPIIFDTGIVEILANQGVNDGDLADADDITVDFANRPNGLNTVIVNTGDSFDTVEVESLSANVTLDLDLAGEGDVVRVSPTEMLLSDIQGTLVIDGGADSAAIVLRNDNTGEAQTFYTVSSTTLTATDFPGITQYSNIGRIDVFGGSNVDDFGVLSSQTELHFHGDDGDDSLFLGLGAGDLDLIESPVTWNAGAGIDLLSAFDAGVDENRGYIIDSTSIISDGSGSFGGVTYDADNTNVSLRTGDGSDTVSILATNSPTNPGNTTVQTGPGSDRIEAQASALTDTVKLLGGFGSDTIVLTETDGAGLTSTNTFIEGGSEVSRDILQIVADATDARDYRFSYEPGMDGNETNVFGFGPKMLRTSTLETIELLGSGELDTARVESTGVAGNMSVAPISTERAIVFHGEQSGLSLPGVAGESTSADLDLNGIAFDGLTISAEAGQDSQLVVFGQSEQGLSDLSNNDHFGFGPGLLLPALGTDNAYDDIFVSDSVVQINELIEVNIDTPAFAQSEPTTPGLIVNAGNEAAFDGDGVADSITGEFSHVFALKVNGQNTLPSSAPNGDELLLDFEGEAVLYSNKEDNSSSTVSGDSFPFIWTSIENTFLDLDPTVQTIELIGDNNDPNVTQNDHFVVVGRDVDSAMEPIPGAQDQFQPDVDGQNEVQVVINGLAPINIRNVVFLNAYGDALTGPTDEGIDTLEITPYADDTPNGWGIDVFFDEGGPAQTDGDLSDLIILHTSAFGGHVSEDIVVKPSGPEAGEIIVTNGSFGTPIVDIDYINNLDIIVLDDDGFDNDTDTLTLLGTNPDNPGTSGAEEFLVQLHHEGTLDEPLVTVSDPNSATPLLYRVREFVGFDSLTLETLGGDDNVILEEGREVELASLNVNTGEGDDLFTLDNSAGIGQFSESINYDGGEGHDGLLLQGSREVTFSIYQVGPTPDRGSITHSSFTTSKRIDFVGLEPVTDLVAANFLEVHANDADNAITYEESPLNSALGRVSIDDFEPIDFANKGLLGIFAHGGDDVTSLARFSPAGLVSARVDSGAPDSQDRIVFEGTTGDDAFFYIPDATERNDGTVSINGFAAGFLNTEAINLNGLDGDDSLNAVSAPQTQDTVLIQPIRGSDGDFQFTRRDFSNAPVSWTSIESSIFDVDGTGSAVVTGTPENDIANIDSFGNTTNVSLNGAFIQILDAGIVTLNLGDGDDFLGVLPGPTHYRINGGLSDNDLFNYSSAFDTNVLLGQGTITSAVHGTVTHTGFERSSIFSASDSITNVFGDSGTERITYSPSSEFAAELTSSNEITAYTLSGQSPITIEGRGTDNTLIFNGTTEDDSILVGDTSIQATGLRSIGSYTGFEAVIVDADEGSDAIAVVASALRTVHVAGGEPTGQIAAAGDSLNVVANGLSFSYEHGPEPDSGTFHVDGQEPISFDEIEQLFVDGIIFLLPDRFEPNDTQATATELGSLPEVTLEDLTIHATQMPVEGAPGASNPDFFVITANQTGKLIINALFKTDDGNLDMVVYDSSGGVIASANSTTDDEKIVIPVVTQETYTIEVFGVNGVFNEYALEIENFAAPVPAVVRLDTDDDTGISNLDNVTSLLNPRIIIQADLADFAAMGIDILDPGDVPASSVTDDGAAVEVYVNGVAVGFASPVNGSNALFSFQSFGNTELTTDLGIPLDLSYLNLVSAAVRIFDEPGETGRSQLSVPLTLTIADTFGPRIDSVKIPSAPGYNLFNPKPVVDGPTPVIRKVRISFSDPFVRSPAFTHPALHIGNASNVGHYRLIGDHVGEIPIAYTTVANDTVVDGQLATGYVELGFYDPLPDDRFTLRVSDGVTDPPLNRLDGESNASQPSALPIFPTGNGIAGGDFVARFTVDTRPEIGVYSGAFVSFDINGNGYFDTNNRDFTNRDLTFHWGEVSDARFTGKFGPPSQLGSYFDVLGAYGNSGGTFRWAIDANQNGAFDQGIDLLFNSNLQINGLPVAGNFDGDRTTGDEIGLFDGTTWYLDTDDDYLLDTTIPSAIPGFPIVGDFDGDGIDDLATYQQDRFFFDLAFDGFGNLNDTVDQLQFPGVADRPVAADINADGIDDIGLWVPNTGTQNTDAEWFFLISEPETVRGTVAVDHPFTPVPLGDDVSYQFGNHLALPIVGNMDPPIVGDNIDVSVRPLGTLDDPIQVPNTQVEENQWFRFNTVDAERVRIRIEFEQLEGTVEAFLYDDSISLLGAATNAPYGAYFDFVADGNATYILRLVGNHDDVSIAISPNQAPELSISDQVMPRSQDALVLQLPSADADGDLVTYSAEFVGSEIEELAYDLNQQHDFLAPTPDYYHNHRGYGEKYLTGDDGTNWYFLLPNGHLYRWTGSIGSSELVASLTSDYHSDPSRLHDATTPTVVVPGQITVSSSQLTIDPDADFSGIFHVKVTATDGNETAIESFQVTVENILPQVDIADQVMPRGEDRRTLRLPATDADGETITYQASIVDSQALPRLAYNLNQKHGFELHNGDDYYDVRGHQEKYLMGDDSSQWYFILPDGSLYRWTTSIATSELVATLSTEYHTDLQKLINAQAPGSSSAPNVVLTVAGNLLTIDPAADYAGDFEIRVAASDGVGSTYTTFGVSVLNAVPTISVADQVIPRSEDKRILSLPSHDSDGDAVTYSATLIADPIGQLAYDLNNEHGFSVSPGGYYENVRGHGEKYLLGDNEANWYFILPSGQLYRWTGSIAGSDRVGTLNGEFHSDPSKLYDAQVPESGSSIAQLTISGASLTIDPANSYIGTFEVRVQATDGVGSVEDSFNVEVRNTLPVLNIADQTLNVGEQRGLVLPATDADGDSLDYSAFVIAPNVIANKAYDLNQQYRFEAPNESYYYNFRGLGEKYFIANGGNDWFYLLANGELYQWGGSIESSSLVATLTSDYHTTPSLLHDAQPSGPNEATVDVTNNIISVTPNGAFAGTFMLYVHVSDGIDTVTKNVRFDVG